METLRAKASPGMDRHQPANGAVGRLPDVDKKVRSSRPGETVDTVEDGHHAHRGVDPLTPVVPPSARKSRQQASTYSRWAGEPFVKTVPLLPDGEERWLVGCRATEHSTISLDFRTANSPLIGGE